MPTNGSQVSVSQERHSGAHALPFALPPPAGQVAAPVWTGGGFAVGQNFEQVLVYNSGDSGWTDELTAFHEKTAADDHCIARSSRDHTVHSLERALTSRDGVIMDIGCSSGAMIRTLKTKFPDATVIGADFIGGPLLELAKDLPFTPLLQFNLIDCPLPDKCLDAVLLLNVLEHIEDDEAALRQVARILKPDGAAVIEVPAGPELYDIYDRQLMHFRRYKMDDLIAKLARSKFKVIERSHLGFFVYPAFWIAKKRGRRFTNESQKVQRRLVASNIRAGKSNCLLRWMFRLESTLRSKIYYPIGIRCLVTCKVGADE